MGDHGEKYEDRNDVDDEGVAAPWSHHVEIGQRWADCPEDWACVAGFQEDVEGEDQCEDGDAFVIVGSSNGSRHVTWSQSNKQRSKQASSVFLGDLSGKQISCNGGERGEDGRNEHTDVADIDWNG